ncbi:unnamed protein product [Lactuca virosa]|uniref:Ubiquitin-like protease family profile domain-containing protein n=1 Tax=Lactuca virosa TaxID=75947 RepID=A0AAU9P1F1_9ASTR|nr:unnamed protein product [Lactuca virosa]
MLPFKIWILETFPEATQYYICTPTELPQMRSWRSKTLLSWVQCRRIINVSVPNNHPIVVVANATELMLPFYIRYVNQTLNHEESPPRQHSPPIVASPPRRKKYKSETSSTETATNASSSQQPEVERTYMSSDTSTRSIKKKTRTKALVKRLIGVVADLTSKVDRVLQKKDEPDTGFGEEEDMGNEEEKETYYHDSLYAASTLGFWKEWNMISSNLNTTHRLHILPLDVEFWSRLLTVTDSGWLISSHIAIWTNDVGGYPKWKDVDMVLFPINVVGVHWFLAVLYLNTWKNSKSFGDSIISELDVIEFWNDFPDGHKANTNVEFVDTIDGPHQEYIEVRGDYGVFICMFMEMIVSRVPVKIDKPHRDAGFLYRNRMTNIIWDTI